MMYVMRLFCMQNLAKDYTLTQANLMYSGEVMCAQCILRDRRSVPGEVTVVGRSSAVSFVDDRIDARIDDERM